MFKAINFFQDSNPTRDVNQAKIGKSAVTTQWRSRKIGCQALIITTLHLVSQINAVWLPISLAWNQNEPGLWDSIRIRLNLEHYGKRTLENMTMIAFRKTMVTLIKCHTRNNVLTQSIIWWYCFFFASFSSKNCPLIGWNPYSATQRPLFMKLLRLILRTKWITPCQTPCQKVSQKSISFLGY